MNRCLSCEQLIEAPRAYHPACLRSLFGRDVAPVIPFGLADFPVEVRKIAGRMSAISGVQPKAFAKINKQGVLSFAEREGTHIIKPAQMEWPELPQNENLCLNIAATLGMETAAHGLVRMTDGEWAYVTRRFDRANGQKIHKEDMAQILGSAVSEKYDGSLEKVGKAILSHATNTGLDVINFFERVLLCFILGNNDMHLKNWSLLELNRDLRRLSPCYDFVSTALYLPGGEESALTINGKRNKLTRRDFDELSTKLLINDKARTNCYGRIVGRRNDILRLVGGSFLSPEYQDSLSILINTRCDRLEQNPEV